MGWTDKKELSEQDKILEQLSGLPMRDYALVVLQLTLSQAFKDTTKIEPSHFRDLSLAALKAIKHVTTCDVLQFLMQQFEKAPANVTTQDVITLLAMMLLSTKGQAEKAMADAQRLVELLPGEQAALRVLKEAQNASE